MHQSSSVSSATIQQWVAEKLDNQKIQQLLLADGYDEEAIAKHLQEVRKLKIAKRQVTGFIYLAAGALLGFISCVLTLVNPVPALYNWILFGLTSIAILVIFIGLYYVFE